MHLIAPSSDKEKLREGDWPPSSFLALNSKNRQEIETLCHKFYGRGSAVFLCRKAAQVMSKFR
jgi:hypothetical protein